MEQIGFTQSQFKKPKKEDIKILLMMHYKWHVKFVKDY